MKEIKTASIVNIITNIFLLTIKFTIGFIFNSISILSDAINSFSDVIASIFIYFSVKINGKKPDKNHPFGHTRAENIAGYTTGILMIFLALTICKLAIEKLISKSTIEYNYLMLIVIIITLITKSSLYIYIRSILKKHKSPALEANMQDHKNDCIIVIGVLIAVIGMKFDIYILDPIIGIIIALYVFIEGFKICKENVNYLMGKKASKKKIELINKTALKVPNVKGTNDLLTQYLGTKIQVEIHIELDKNLSLKESHDVGKEVKYAIEELEDINNCFVHIDVYKENK